MDGDCFGDVGSVAGLWGAFVVAKRGCRNGGGFDAHFIDAVVFGERDNERRDAVVFIAGEAGEASRGEHFDDQKSEGSSAQSLPRVWSGDGA